LWARLLLLVDPEHHIEGMTESDWGERGQKVPMLGLVPVCCEAIGHADEERAALYLQGFGWLEPCPDDLLRQLPTRLVEEPGPEV
jgi:hypothetical protein